MSAAHKCDRCGNFYGDDAGSIVIENLHVSKGFGDGECASWEELDLCAHCAAPILKRLYPACNELEATLKPKEEKPA
jgi:hypothetical protein